MICVRNLQRRMAALEEAFADSDGGGQGKGPYENYREFVRAFFSALGHIRREPIDSPDTRYSIYKLHSLEAFDCGGYVAALAVRHHEDEEEAREILEAKLGGEDEGLRGLIDIVVRRVKSG